MRSKRHNFKTQIYISAKASPGLSNHSQWKPVAALKVMDYSRCTGRRWGRYKELEWHNRDNGSCYLFRSWTSMNISAYIILEPIDTIPLPSSIPGLTFMQCEYIMIPLLPALTIEFPF